MSSNLPPSALLAAYASADCAANYVDCFIVESDRDVSIAEFVAAFYTTPLFKLERFILRFFAGLESADDDAVAVAQGASDRFAAWTVESRSPSQLLMCDVNERTRSWFMVDVADGRCRLYFGSAVLPVRDSLSGEERLGSAFRALLGVHRAYSVLLLRAAHRKLSR